MKKFTVSLLIFVIFTVFLFGCNKPTENTETYEFPEIKPLSIDSVSSVASLSIESGFSLPDGAEIIEVDYKNRVLLIKADGKYSFYDFSGNKLTEGIYESYEKTYNSYCLYGQKNGAIFYTDGKIEKKFPDNKFISLNYGYYMRRDGTSYRLQLFNKNDELIKVLYDADSRFEAFICDRFLIYNNRKLNVIQLYDLMDASFSKEFPNTGYAKLCYLGQGDFIYIDVSSDKFLNYIYSAPTDTLRAVDKNISGVYNEYNTTDFAFDSPYSLFVDDVGVYIAKYDFERIYRLDGTSLNFIDGYAINDNYTKDGKQYVTRINTDGIPQKSVLIFDNCSVATYNSGVIRYNHIDGEEILYGAKTSDGVSIFNEIYDFISVFVDGYAIGYITENEQKTYYSLNKNKQAVVLNGQIDTVYSFFYSVSSQTNIELYDFKGEKLCTLQKNNSSSAISQVYSGYTGGHFVFDNTIYFIKVN